MPYSVLQPVERRRRRPRRRRHALALLLLAAVLAAVTLGVSRHWAFANGKTSVAEKTLAKPRPHRVTAAKLAKLRATEAEQRSTTGGPFAAGAPLLAAAAPRLEHRLQRPITAPAAILVDANTGAVLWGKRAHQRRPVASTTKIMTGVLALEHLPPNKVVRVYPLVTRVALHREGHRARARVHVWMLSVHFRL